MPTLSARRLMCAAAFALPVGGAAAQSTPAQSGEPPLGGFASQKVAVLPVQLLRSDTASAVKTADWAALRKELDDSIGAAIAARGIGRKWAYAPDVARMAKRNADYVSDPYSLGAAALRNPQKKVGDQAPQVVVNNLRSLIALGDTRFALVPVDLWFSKNGADTRAVLHVVMIDGRAGLLIWFADVAGMPATKFSAAEIGALAQRFADLVVAR